MTASLHLGFDAAFDDLHDREGLVRLDARFLDFLGERDADLKTRLEAARQAPGAIEREAHSELIIDLAPVLETFVGELFGVEAELDAMRGGREALALLYSVKRLFVQRRAVKKYASEAETADVTDLRRQLEAHLGAPLSELVFAEKVD